MLVRCSWDDIIFDAAAVTYLDKGREGEREERGERGEKGWPEESVLDNLSGSGLGKGE